MELSRDDLERSGEHYDPDAETVPRQAASVIVIRGGDDTLELLLVKRNPAQRFMGGAWVFPGGAVDADEGEGDGAHRAAAVRELAEEATIAGVDPAALVKFSRWITPAGLKIRFDTHFFIAEMPDAAEARADGQECVEARWFTPQGALGAHRDEEILLVFPTIKHLEQVGRFATATSLLAYAGGRDAVTVVPKMVVTGESAQLLLPGEPGYDD